MYTFPLLTFTRTHIKGHLPRKRARTSRVRLGMYIYLNMYTYSLSHMHTHQGSPVPKTCPEYTPDTVSVSGAKYTTRPGMPNTD